MLTENMEQLQTVADYLVDHETMTGDQFRDCMEGREISEATQTSLFDAFQIQPEAEDAAEIEQIEEFEE